MTQITSRRQATRCRNQRGGLSLLEFLGCLIAIVGGMWLGAIYLGVDVRHTVYNAMAETDVLDKVPPQWRPVDPDSAFTREQMVSALREELGTLRTEIADLRSDEEPPTGEQRDLPTRRAATVDVSLHNTMAYWNRINEIVLGESDLQRDADSALTESSAARVFALKGRVSRFAAKAVEAIPSADVDGSVLQFGQQLQQWYEHGGTLYERAAQIWQLPVASQRTHLTQRWTPAEMHHHNEAKLLSEKGAALREILSRRYGERFPAFAAPASAPGGQDAGQESAG